MSTDTAPPHDPSVIIEARTFLFVPGDRPDRFAKATAAGADIVILDLEDAVAPENKSRARGEVHRWLADGGRACVRVNPVDSRDHEDDVAILTGLPGLTSIMLPKSQDPAHLSALAQQASIPIVALVETAAGILNAPALAHTTGVTRLAFGHLDYASDVGAEPTRLPMLFARASLVTASAAAGLPAPIDGVTTALDDPEALVSDIEHAKSLGFSAKLLIHPKQVASSHAALRPSEEEIKWAQRVVSASRVGGEAVRVDGHMVDAPVLARARLLLDRVI